jgi:hypothetical protein
MDQLRGSLTALWDDPAGMALKAKIEGAIGPKVTTKKWPEAWALATVEFRLLTPFLGAQSIVGNDLLETAYRRSSYKSINLDKCDPKTIPLVFERCIVRDALVIHRACVRGFLRGHLKQAGKSDMGIAHFGTRDIRVKPKTPLSVIRLALPNDPNAPKNVTAKGMCYHEALSPGEVLTMQFSWPTRNYLSPEEMEAWLRLALEAPVRSMSPARGTQYGASELVSFSYELYPAGVAMSDDPARSKRVADDEVGTVVEVDDGEAE